MFNIKNRLKSLKKKSKYGAMYMSTVVKVIACVVVGALVISGLAVVTNGAFNTASDKVSTLFEEDYNYAGGAHGGAGGGGAIVPGEGESDCGTLDGNKTLLNQGGYYTLPENDKAGFVGYLSSNKVLYAANSSVPVEKDNTFSTVELDFEMESVGYKVREKNETYGIRYYTKLNTGLIEELRDAGATITVGTLIGPADIIGEDDLTFELDSKKYVNVVFDVNLGYYTEGDFEGVVGSMANIKDKNANRDFLGRGYVSVYYEDDNGNVIDKTYYAKYAGNDKANNSANIAHLSYQLKQDTAEYNALSAEIKEKVDHYSSLYAA